MRPMMVALWMLVAVVAVQAQEPKPIPNDSVEVEARGCLKGRVFTATAVDDNGAPDGPDIVGRRFRVSGSRDVMDLVKKHNGHRVTVVGIVRKSALADAGTGIKVGSARIVIGAQGSNPARPNQPTTAPVPSMDVTAVRHLADRCSY